MARKKRGAKKSSGRGSSKAVLSDHSRQGSTLVPPLMQFPLQELSWHQQALPDFLWIALMMGRRSDWVAVRSALNVIDRFVPKDSRIVDGRLSTFAFVPIDRRLEARAALRDEASHALPTSFAHVLEMYPDCPASWLYEDWSATHEPDLEIGLPLVRSLIAENTDKSGVRETRLRMTALVRQVLHGKLKMAADSSFALVPRYPNRLTTKEQRMVESTMRASWMSFMAMEALHHPEASTWPADFWRRSRELASCQIPTSERGEISMPKEDGPLDPEPLMKVSEMAEMLRAVEAVGFKLREIQTEVVDDPATDEPNAVLLGLASRTYRLLYAFLERPSAWVPDTSGLHIRPLVDARILIGWLITRDDPGIFAAYREHGLGRLKLLREHIKADFGDEPDDEARQYLKYLDTRVNLERGEWFQPVNLGSYADVSPRKMAIEADLKREYDLCYAPLSSENHGEWPALRDSDTVTCKEPLHGGHRIGAFGPPTHTINDFSPLFALDLGCDGIAHVFDYYGRDVRPIFEDLHDAVRSALFDSEQ